MNQIRKHRPLDLSTLRGFESSARLLSFTKAAQELHLTQSAVSRQVQGLEDELGRALFKRATRRIELTRDGQRLLSAVQALLRGLDETVQAIRGREALHAAVSFSSFGSFASLWLIPRLPAFHRLHPDVDIRISAVDRFQDIRAERIDLVVRYCRPSDAPADAVLLFPESIVVIASPALVKRGKGIRKVEDLAHHTWLAMHDFVLDSPVTWETWLERAGAPDLKPAKTVAFNMTDQIVQAVLAQQGVGLGRWPLVRDMIERGELVMPLDVRVSDERNYYLITNPESRDRLEVQQFSQWLQAEAAKQFAAGKPARSRAASKR